MAHVHIKDGRATDDGRLEWTIVGDGEIDYVGHFRALKESGYDGVVALETHYKDPNGDQEAASRLCLAEMRRLIDTV